MSDRMLPIAAEGWGFILGPLALAALLTWAGWIKTALGLAALAAFAHGKPIRLNDHALGIPVPGPTVQARSWWLEIERRGFQSTRKSWPRDAASKERAICALFGPFPGGADIGTAGRCSLGLRRSP